ncbi:hypothetical protein [Luteolibacter marinus]|uniref:hypothetical protein n=1 Tax=Luteolibacter marinus TaxID=2776705 RepID=UPI001865C17A|nr:hypothetical protein [Luteolibacter marinus]
MLTAGFATIVYLKSRLLPDAAAGEAEWDDEVAALGKSVAGKFDRHCNRDFARSTAAVDTFKARASAWVLRRYPVESLDTVEVIDPDGTATEQVIDEWQLDESSGLLESDTLAGSLRQKLRITYTGGYWLDPRDGTAMPAEANALPDDVLEAWVAQCQHEAESRGLFSAVSFRSQSDDGPRTTGLGLLDDVAYVLRSYRRFSGE